MSQATFSVRMDDSLKKQFEHLCNDFGMNMSTAVNIFARAVVREKRIPFDIVSFDSDITREKALQTFMAIRDQSAKNFPEGMSLEDINAEIDLARSERVTE